jgi:hypothetical protein
MAHDRQLPEELREPSSELSKLTGKASESLAVLRDWWAVYGQIYRDDPTELLAVAFRETLQNLPASVLHEACLRAQRECPQFRPTPGKIYAIAESLLDQRQRGNRILYAPVSQGERDAAMEETKEQRWALKQKLGIKVDA